MPLWINIVVIILLGNASASTEWCRRQFQSPHNWTCLAAESSFPTCCPPGSICLKNICSPTPSGSSDLPEMTPSDWYAPCFYPNGDIEPKDMPCSSQGGACCPGRWQCLSNGLCYNEFRYERHTCTDQAWGPSCPQVCETDLGSIADASEDILMCGTNDTQLLGCCNGKVGGSGSCCTDAYALSFALPSGTVVASLGDTPSAWESFLRSSATTAIPTSSATSTFTTITSNSDGVISTIVRTAFITAAPTSSFGPSIDTSNAPTPGENATSGSTSGRPMSTILGTAIGIPLGLAALIAVLIVLRRHRRYNTPDGQTPEIYFPPDPIYNPATKVLPRVELDAQSKEIYELDGQIAPSKLKSSTRAGAHSKDPSTGVHELDATSNALPESSNRISTITTAYEPRLSSVSSLAPPPQHCRIAGGVPPTSTALQTVSQEHYGPAQSAFLVPESLYRLDRPLSGTLPAAQAAESDLSLTPRSVADVHHGRDVEKAHECQAAHADHESKHVMPEEAHEEIKEIHGVAKVPKGVVPDEGFRTDGGDDANAEGHPQAGESK